MTDGSAGSPTLTKLLTKLLTLSTKPSCLALGTRTRVHIAQPWPAWKKAGPAANGATWSRSASSSRIAADFPPSSRCTRFRVGAAAAMMRLPVATLPVKLILSTNGLSTSLAPSSGRSPVTTLNTPAGRSHSSIASAINRSISGAYGDGLITMVQPAARAGPIFWTVTKNGKFQVGMRPHTPTG